MSTPTVTVVSARQEHWGPFAWHANVMSDGRTIYGVQLLVWRAAIALMWRTKA